MKVEEQISKIERIAIRLGVLLLAILTLLWLVIDKFKSIIHLVS